MHPTKSIKNQKTSELEGKRIALGITGSIAAIMSVKLSRELIRHGAEVQAVMSKSATKIINPMSLEYATGNRVIQEITGKIEHVRELGEEGKSDLYLIAPSTANTISKIAAGIDDTTVTTFATTALSTKAPILIAPAMHETMINQSILQEKIKYLKDHGIGFINPKVRENKAKLAEIEDILLNVKKELLKNKVEGKKILITAGPTYTEIDDVRVLTNRSTGETGKKIALEAAKRGAEVTFVHGDLKVSPPRGCKNIYSPSYKDMKKTVLKELKKDKDYLISTAAISDFGIEKKEKKISSTNSHTLNLEPTEKIIKKAKEKFPKTKIISFKLEENFQEIKEKAKELLKNSNLVIGNKINEVDAKEKYFLFLNKEIEEIHQLTKKELAEELIKYINKYED